MRALFMLGRIVFGGYFVYNGLNHLQNAKMMSQYAASRGVPQPDIAVPASGGLILAGGLSIVSGFKPRQGLAAIVAFLIPVTMQMHRFWDTADPTERMNQTAHFGKNMALLGAALMLMQIEQPWPVGIDEARAGDEDMYVRLGGRDLRSLPA